jgi:hypothetical protein
LYFSFSNPVMRVICVVRLCVHDFIIWIIFGEEYKSWSSSLRNCLEAPGLRIASCRLSATAYSEHSQPHAISTGLLLGLHPKDVLPFLCDNIKKFQHESLKIILVLSCRYTSVIHKWNDFLHVTLQQWKYLWGWFNRNPPGVDYIISVELTQKKVSARIQTCAAPGSCWCLHQSFVVGFDTQALPYTACIRRWVSVGWQPSAPKNWSCFDGCGMWYAVFSSLPHITPLNSRANARKATNWRIFLHL